MSVWRYKSGDYRDFEVPVDCFKEATSYVENGFLYMNSVLITNEPSTSEIIHEDGHKLLIAWTGPGRLKFNLDEEGLIDSWEIVPNKDGED